MRSGLRTCKKSWLLAGLIIPFFGKYAFAETATATATQPETWNWQATGIIITGVLGILAFFATYLNNALQERRRANIAFISNQLEKLYGPLLALSSSTDEAWSKFQERHRRGKTYFFDDSDPPTEEETREFRHWMKIVFMPTNLEMQEVISANAHLIEGSSMPIEFLDFLAHVQAYQAVIAKWNSDESGPEFTKRITNTSYLNYPPNLNGYVRRTFADLKARQDRLLATRRAS